MPNAGYVMTIPFDRTPTFFWLGTCTHGPGRRRALAGMNSSGSGIKSPTGVFQVMRFVIDPARFSIRM
jgi:hypothetical protein